MFLCHEQLEASRTQKGFSDDDDDDLCKPTGFGWALNAPVRFSDRLPGTSTEDWSVSLTWLYF